MASWVDSLLHTFMQVFDYSVERKKKKQTSKNKAAQNKEKDWASSMTN